MSIIDLAQTQQAKQQLVTAATEQTPFDQRAALLIHNIPVAPLPPGPKK